MSWRPYTTLFLLASVDGKISTGAGAYKDMDAELPLISATAKGLHHYYDIEAQTDLCCLCSGKVINKAFANEPPELGERKRTGVSDVTIITVDKSGYLTEQDLRRCTDRFKRIIILSTFKASPKYLHTLDALIAEGLSIEVELQHSTDFVKFFQLLSSKYGIDRVTVQTGSSINGTLLKHKLIDALDIVMAPVLIGGATYTPSIVGGVDVWKSAELGHVTGLRLRSCEDLGESYIRLRYDIVRDGDD